MFIKDIINQFISDEWVNYRHRYIEPEAREMLLGDAGLYFYHHGTTNLIKTYSDKKCLSVSTHPVLADRYGRFPDVFFDSEFLEVPRKVELKDKNNMILASATTDEDFSL